MCGGNELLGGGVHSPNAMFLVSPLNKTVTSYAAKENADTS